MVGRGLRWDLRMLALGALVVLATVLCLGAPAAASAAVTWTPQTLPVKDIWYGVAFTDAQHGWAVGQMGNIIATTDGGATWTVQTTLSQSLYECFFADSTHGWAVGPLQVYATTDGSTWSPQTAPDGWWEDVEMADARTGWIVGDVGVIAATTDGGATWTSQSSGTTSNLYDVHVRSASEAWAAGDDGVVLHTTDGGTTWSKQTVDAAERLYCVVFSDQQHGWLGSMTGSIYATTDGGATWTKQTSGATGTLWRSAAFLGGRVWMVGAAGVLLTEDGGAAWAAQDTGSTARAWDCVFAKRGLGWVAGDDSMVKYEEKYTITAVSGDKGGVTPGTTDVIAGDDQTFEFTPDAGYQVADVLVDGASVGAPSSYTFEDVTGAHTIGVAFEPTADNHPVCSVRGWVKGWSNRAVKLRITAKPGPYGYAIDLIGLTLNGWVTAPYKGSELVVPVGEQGVTRVGYWAMDVHGNASPHGRLAVRVDSKRPQVVARAATGEAGGAARLAYKVKDEVPGCGRALVRLVVLDASGKVLTRSSTRQAPVNAWRTVRVSTRGLAPGTYTVVLRAMDLAGNFQQGVTRTMLIVR